MHAINFRLLAAATFPRRGRMRESHFPLPVQYVPVSKEGEQFRGETSEFAFFGSEGMNVGRN